MLSYVLDVSRINSQTVLCLNTNKNPRTGVDSFKFGWDLGLALVKPQMVVRLQKGGLRRSAKSKIEVFVNDDKSEDDEDDQERAGGDGVMVAGGAAGVGAEEQEQSPLFPNPSFADKRLRCEQCTSQIPVKGYKLAQNKAAQMKTRCSRCSAAVCKEHSVIVCQECTADLQVKAREEALSD